MQSVGEALSRQGVTDWPTWIGKRPRTDFAVGPTLGPRTVCCVRRYDKTTVDVTAAPNTPTRTYAGVSDRSV
jgi:hypothetical protein